jgi:hypothetical protein
MRGLITVVLVAAALLLGGRVLLGAAQRQQCGAPGGTALVLSVQALGAAPSATECLGLALTRPAGSSPAPATTPPPATILPPTTPPTTEDPAAVAARERAEARQREATAKRECADEDAALRRADAAYQAADRKLDDPGLSDAEYQQAHDAWTRVHAAWLEASNAVDQCYFDHGVATPGGP